MEPKTDIFTTLFERAYDTVMFLPEKNTLAKYRKKLLGNLRGEILEVGSGTGANFPFYNESARVTALEPSPHMADLARQKASELHIETINIVQGAIGLNPWDDAHQAGHYDAIVCTLVLCTLPEPLKSLSYFAHWLKPNGKLIVLEHVASRNPLAAWGQNVLHPLWKTMAGGCNLNRPTEDYLEQTGFVPDNLERFDLLLPFIAGNYRLRKTIR